MPLSQDQLPYSTRRVGKEGCRMKTDRDMQLTPELFYIYFFRFGMFRHKFRHFFTLTLYHLTFSFPGHTIFYICVTVHYFHSYICTLHFFCKGGPSLSDFSDLLDHAIARSNLSMLELAGSQRHSDQLSLQAPQWEYVLRKNIPPTFCP